MKDNVITLSSDMYYDITYREYVSDLIIPSKAEGFKIYLHRDYDENYNGNFETGIPSNESFFMFGGIYYPTDGLLYASVDRYKEAVVVCNISDYLSRVIRQNLGHGHVKGVLENLDTITKLFKRFKVTGDDKSLESILTSRDNHSTVFRHMMGYTADIDSDTYTFDVVSLLKGDLVFYIYSVEKFFSILMKRSLSKSNLSKEEKDTLKRSYSIFDDIDYGIDQTFALNGLIDDVSANGSLGLRKICTRDYYLSGDIINKSRYINNDVSVKNIVELIECQSEEPIYSSDIKKLLKKNHFLSYLSDMNVGNIKYSGIGSNVYSELSIVDRFKPENFRIDSDKTKQYNANIVSSLITDIVYINKTFRKL